MGPIIRNDARIISDDHTQKYLSDLDNMHKVVLETGPDDLSKISEKLKEAGVDHKLWIEQPENFPTCLAVKPYPKEVGPVFFIFTRALLNLFLLSRRFRSISRSSNFTKGLSSHKESCENLNFINFVK